MSFHWWGLAVALPITTPWFFGCFLGIREGIREIRLSKPAGD